MKTRIAAAAAIAIILLLASYSALVGGAATDSQAGNGSEENTTRPVSVSPQTTVGLPLQDSRSECVQATAPLTGESAIDVPSFCIGELCQIMLWDDARSGAFGSGLRMPVYYTQNPTDATWIGGPNLNLAGATFSDEGGTNGDAISDTIYGGGVTSEGNLYSLYDDWGTEISSTQWMIRFEGTAIQEEAPVFYVCPLVVDAMFERFDVSSAGTMTVPVPDFCIDGVCGILLWSDANMGAFGPGMLWPVHYTQNSGDGSWIGGPNTPSGIADADFSKGAGVNGDGVTDTVFIGGETSSGSYVRLHDDSVIESSPDQWTIEFVPDSNLTEAAYLVYPLMCDHHPITLTGGTVISMPLGCIEGMCTVLTWHNGGSMTNTSAFGAGIQLPVYYTQSPTDDTWIGGPHLCLAGMCLSEGAGTNGAYGGEEIYEGGRTPSGGYVGLSDDSNDEAYGSESILWTAFLEPQDDLTEAAVYICPGWCVQYDVPVRFITDKVWLPLVQRVYSP